LSAFEELHLALVRCWSLREERREAIESWSACKVKIRADIYAMCYLANADASDRSCIVIISFAPHAASSFTDPTRAAQHLPNLHVLAQPPDALTVSLPHDHTAHEHLNRPDTLKWHLALARRLVQAEGAAQLVFRHGLGMVDLVSEDDKGRVLKLFHGEQRVELGFGFVEALVVFGVDEEDDA
jgi:hypothetical protein